MLAQLALIDTLGQLAILRDAAAPAGAPAKVYLDEATALYRRLERRTLYSPMLDRSAWAGMFMTAAVVAGGLTLVAGWALLRRYRRRIAQLMMASSRGAVAPLPVHDESRPLSATTLAPPAGDATIAIAQATAARRRAALVQVSAGLGFGVVAAWLQLRADDTEPNLRNMALDELDLGVAHGARAGPDLGRRPQAPSACLGCVSGWFAARTPVPSSRWSIRRR